MVYLPTGSVEGDEHPAYIPLGSSPFSFTFIFASKGLLTQYNIKVMLETRQHASMFRTDKYMICLGCTDGQVMGEPVWFSATTTDWCEFIVICCCLMNHDYSLLMLLSVESHLRLSVESHLRLSIKSDLYFEQLLSETFHFQFFMCLWYLYVTDRLFNSVSTFQVLECRESVF